MENRAHTPLNGPNPPRSPTTRDVIARLSSFGKDILRNMVWIGAVCVLTLASVVVFVLFRNSMCATPAGYGHPLCSRADALARPVRVQAMTVSATYRGAAEICKSADFFAQASRSAEYLGSDELWGTNSIFQHTAQFHADLVTRRSNSVAEVLTDLCFAMFTSADQYVYSSSIIVCLWIDGALQKARLDERGAEHPSQREDRDGGSR